jgi:hypothetical protein
LAVWGVFLATLVLLGLDHFCRVAFVSYWNISTGSNGSFACDALLRRGDAGTLASPEWLTHVLTCFFTLAYYLLPLRERSCACSCARACACADVRVPPCATACVRVCRRHALGASEGQICSSAARHPAQTSGRRVPVEQGAPRGLLIPGGYAGRTPPLAIAARNPCLADMSSGCWGVGTRRGRLLRFASGLRGRGCPAANDAFYVFGVRKFPRPSALGHEKKGLWPRVRLGLRVRRQLRPLLPGEDVDGRGGRGPPQCRTKT